MKIGNNYMKKQIIELTKDYNLYERFVLKLHAQLFTKIYHKIRVEIVNNTLK